MTTVTVQYEQLDDVYSVTTNGTTELVCSCCLMDYLSWVLLERRADHGLDDDERLPRTN